MVIYVPNALFCVPDVRGAKTVKWSWEFCQLSPMEFGVLMYLTTSLLT